MNVKLLRRIQRVILKTPKRLNMDEGICLDDSTAPCRTAACIAGTAVLLDAQDKFKLGWKEAALKLPKRNRSWNGKRYIWWETVDRKARKLLGITPQQGDRLFMTDKWPDPWSHDKARSRKERAKIASDRISLFIKTGGKL